MPFTSPFGSITTPSFNPNYSNVPQNKPPKPLSIPQAKPPSNNHEPETPSSSVEELNSGVTPHIFTPENMEAPQTAEFNPVPMAPQTPPIPMFMPAQFNPYAYTMGEPPRVQLPQMPRRINPYRPIFV